jgi:hypothetical protein
MIADAKNSDDAKIPENDTNPKKRDKNAGTVGFVARTMAGAEGMPESATVSGPNIPDEMHELLQPDQVQHLIKTLERFGEGAQIVVSRRMSSEEMGRKGVNSVDDISRGIIDSRESSDGLVVSVIQDPKKAELGVDHEHSAELPSVDAVTEMVTEAKKDHRLEDILGDEGFLRFWCKENDGNKAILVYVQRDGRIDIIADVVHDDVGYNAALTAEIINPLDGENAPEEGEKQGMTVEEARQVQFFGEEWREKVAERISELSQAVEDELSGSYEDALEFFKSQETKISNAVKEIETNGKTLDTDTGALLYRDGYVNPETGKRKYTDTMGNLLNELMSIQIDIDLLKKMQSTS